MTKRPWLIFYFAWVVSLIGTFISLYFGEVLQLEPCRLCWYQRISLFPLALLLGVAVYRKDFSFLPYGMMLAGSGIVIATYHSLEAIFSQLHSITLCGANCGQSSIQLFGFIPFPVFSAIGFVLIFALLWLTAWSRRGTD